MRVLLPCLALLAMLPGGARASDDPLVERYKEFFRSSVAPRWESDETSEMRVVILRGFARHDVPDAAEWLVGRVLAGSDAGDELRAAVDMLAGYSKADTLEELAESWDRRLRKPVSRRALGLFAFREAHGEAWKEVLGEALDERDPRVVRAACEVLGATGRRELLEPLREQLESRSPIARGAAALALAELGDQESLPVLFAMFCGEESHRARYDVWLALKKLSLETLPCDPSAWRDWWEKQRGDPAEGESSPWGDSFPRVHSDAAKAGSFFGIPVLADRLVVVLDTSQSMLEPWAIDHQAERAKPPEERTPGFFGVKTRWDLARNHLKEVLEALPEDVEVGLVCYDSEIFRYPEGSKLFRNTERNRDRALAWMEDDVRRKGTTSMYDGLAQGWGFVRDGDPDANFKAGADTLLFVTDGTPTDGTFAKREDRIRDEAWAVAKARGVRIHTVGVHYHAYELCKAMAKDSGGLYVHAQEAGDTTEPQDLDFWPEKKKAFEAARKAGNR